MKKVAIGFSCHSNSVRRGAIGAIDDWLVCITRPWEYFYDVASLVTFYSRNDVYALNVQCLVDHEKIVLWAFYSHRGSSHDSTCFRATDLNTESMKPMQSHLFSLSYFILGDLAYAIESLSLPPFDNVKSKSPEDVYNFYHGSARITVE